MTENKEKVLVIPKVAACPGGVPLDTIDMVELIDQNSFFMDRELAEVDERYVQIIPYVIIRFLDEDSKNEEYNSSDYIFLYQRLKKSSEARLHSKFSVGIGGHINPIDVGDDPPSYTDVIKAAIREIHEEIQLEDDEHDDRISEELLYPFEDPFIYDDSNEVGKVHLGIIFTYEANSKNVNIKETTKMEGKFVSLKELETLRENRDQFENWTNIALDRILLE